MVAGETRSSRTRQRSGTLIVRLRTPSRMISAEAVLRARRAVIGLRVGSARTSALLRAAAVRLPACVDLADSKTFAAELVAFTGFQLCGFCFPA